MKENKLMIGNLLQGKMVVTVSEIRKNNRVSVEGSESTFIVGECLSFIPLTDEWIEKFGGKTVGDSVHWPGFALDIEEGNTGIGFFYPLRERGMMDLHVEFVHQLQNLYCALSGGKELTYTL